MMQNIFFSLLSAVFIALSSLHRDICGSRERKMWFVKARVRYTEGLLYRQDL